MSNNSLHEVTKNTQETLRFQITEYKGQQYVDIRVYYRDDNDELRPSKKGLTISPAIWSEFKAGIECLDAELHTRKLIEQEQEQCQS